MQSFLKINRPLTEGEVDFLDDDFKDADFPTLAEAEKIAKLFQPQPPEPDPEPHESWGLTDDQKYTMYMEHFHYYGIKNWKDAFRAIYGKPKGLVKDDYRHNDYVDRDNQYGIRNVKAGMRRFDIGYKVPFNERRPEKLPDGYGYEDNGQQTADRPERKDGQTVKIVLPKIVSIGQMQADSTMMLKPDLLDGIVRKGDKLFVGGASKSNKTWFVLGFGISVAAGRPFLGRNTLKAKVLYINFELRPASVRKRIREIVAAMGIEFVSIADDLHVWSLRGYAASIDILKPKIIEATAGEKYGLIIIDPAYKCLGNRNENDAGQMNDFCNELEAIGEKTGATLAVALHFAKGSASTKAAQDRTSGSGVFARDPDAIFNLTPHKEENALTASVIVRDHPPVDEFVVRWKYPLFEKDGKLDPKDLKNPNGNDAKDIKDSDVVEAFGHREFTTDGIIDVLKDEFGVGINRARDAFNHAKTHGMIEERSRNRRQAGRPSILYGLSPAGKKLLQHPYAAENQAIEDGQAEQGPEMNRHKPEIDPFADM